MQDIWSYLKAANKPIVLYGMGNGADKIVNVLRNNSIKISGVFVSDGFVRNKTYLDMPITDYKTAEQAFGNMIVLLCFGSNLPNVLENVKRISNLQELYVPDVPVYESELFDLNFAKLHKKELLKVYNLLADEKSKKVFENTVLYKITADPNYLYSCEGSRSEYFEILNLKGIKSAVDLGAYNGDSAKELLGYCPDLCQLIAVEPDKRSFRKLSENLADTTVCEKIFACAGDCDKTVFLSDAKGRGSFISDSGVKTVCRSVDSILNGRKTDYIKFDVEGNELAAITGAKQTIKNFKPKLCVAAYHKSEDLFSLVLKVLSIRDDYKVYMRRTPCLPAWDTDFIFV